MQEAVALDLGKRQRAEWRMPPGPCRNSDDSKDLAADSSRDFGCEVAFFLFDAFAQLIANIIDQLD